MDRPKQPLTDQLFKMERSRGVMLILNILEVLEIGHDCLPVSKVLQVTQPLLLVMDATLGVESRLIFPQVFFLNVLPVYPDDEAKGD